MSIAVSAPHGCITLPHANCCMLPISKVSRMSCATCSPDACSWHTTCRSIHGSYLAEYSRMGASIPVDQSTMLCTMKLSRSLIGRGKLADCCEYFGIANEDAHSALSDAHATAILLGRLVGKPTRNGPASNVGWTRPVPLRNNGPHSQPCRRRNGCRAARILRSDDGH